MLRCYFLYFAGMKRVSIFYLFLPFLFIACKNSSSEKSENNLDAARNFIRAALDGKFSEARTYMLADSVNTNYLDVVERSYQRIDQAKKEGYRTSTIHIHQVNPVNDSTTIVIYSNSFMNDHDTLKVLKKGDQWLVDLKYLYEHDRDTLQASPVNNDTLK